MPSDSGSAGRAVALSKTFGTDVTPSAWREFKDHFLLVKKANIARGIALWNDASYCSVELRLCLTGAPAEFIREEAAQSVSWVKDDVEILDRLEKRYVTVEAIEVRIIRFEEACQGDDETLADFLTRLQRLAGDAFSSESAEIKRKRVVWRFLDGLKDRDIRERLIRERWMKDESHAKDYDDVLKIAETARTSKQAASLTGSRHQPGAGFAAPVQRAPVPMTSLPPDGRAQRGPGRSSPGPVRPRPPPALGPGQPVPRVTGQGHAAGGYRRGGDGGYRHSADGRGGRPIGRCYYCDAAHPGGWFNCQRRMQENPSWTPRRVSTGQQGLAAPIVTSEFHEQPDFL